MKTTPTVSIAMATYNGARFIAEQLDSLTRQTVAPSELVVTDDASTDATLDIVAAFAVRAPFPVRVEKNPARLGYRANFMKAAALCRSDFIAFCDQDDVWLPLKLAACLAAFEHEDVLLAYHNATVVTAALEPIGSLEGYAAPRAINQPQSMGPWPFGLGFTLVFRRALLDFSGYWSASANFTHPDMPEGHDQWVFFLASNLGTIGYVREPLALYRQHGANTFGWNRDARSGMSRLWSNIVSTGTAGLAARELSARKRASILERAQGKLDGDRRRRAGMAAAGYRKLETVYRLRREMYRTDGIFSRFSRLTALARLGAYRPGTEWGVGPKARARDIVRGILFPVREN